MIFIARRDLRDHIVLDSQTQIPSRASSIYVRLSEVRQWEVVLTMQTGENRPHLKAPSSKGYSNTVVS